ncbi:TonB-dependent receptor plug domain-containing protein [Daejeonella lutea]|uniref:TonB-dependent Receptor Plug Domain n=1 Tax=Daejeonella lutea TaxID=572036 RepID=A0A1T5EXW2_9SPHI|nr:TonB-dependent receptor plug domain-containing protein [Daejeonella lutea]SKB88782.1 TonB-dependent Receptor Plug Domain [Daejeonella lutea]
MKSFVVILFLLYSLAGFGQSRKLSLEQFIASTDSINDLYPPEKVYLHLDKPFYAAGQNIWFKAYVVDGSNQPSMLSKILYVDLINEEKQIKKTLKLPLSAGLGWGDIALPDTLSEGNYRIRGYTQWMRNFGEESFYDHSLVIVNSFKSGTVKNKAQSGSQAVTVQFFPEGGQQVEGVRSRVAFKALASNGLGKDMTGYVMDNLGTKVAEFKSDHAGMGSFLLTPFEGQSYKAIVSLPEGEKTFPIPSAAKDGYVISVNTEPQDKILIRITATPTAPIDDRELTVAVKTYDGSILQSSFKMTRQFADVAISKGELKTGIAQLTLFDKNDMAVAERLVFTRKNGDLNISVQSGKDAYSKREKVKLDIAPTFEDQSQAIASFSVAVTDMDRVGVKEDDETTIFSELLVKSELKGFVEQPNYYFTRGAEAVKLKQKHLDNLLMTQGWRRLDWTKNKPKLSLIPEKGISISGTVSRGGSPVAGGKVTAFTPDGGMLMDTVSNSKGWFNFDNLVFPDSTRFIVQGRTEKSKANVQIKLDQVSRQSVGNDVFFASRKDEIPDLVQTYGKDIKEELAELLKQGLITRNNVLNEVVVKGVKDSKTLTNSSKLGNSPADYTFRSEQLSDPNLAFALKGKVLGFDFHIGEKGVVTGSLARNTMVSGPPAMELFVDGMPMGTDLSQVNMQDVAYVEVLKGGASAAIYGGKAAAGILIVTTKGYAGISNNNVQTDAQGIIKYLPQGYTVSRTFYSPDYAAPETQKAKADFRSTIYWNPDIFSDKGVVKPIEFYTADRPGIYRVVVEGLDYKGRLGRSVKTFTVQ